MKRTVNYVKYYFKNYTWFLSSSSSFFFFFLFFFLKQFKLWEISVNQNAFQAEVTCSGVCSHWKYFWKLDQSEMQNLRLCLVTVFVFYFQKLVFGNIKKKHVWLIEVKKIVFFEKKRKRKYSNMLLVGFQL